MSVGRSVLAVAMVALLVSACQGGQGETRKGGAGLASATAALAAAPNALCAVSGAAGAIVRCPLRLATGGSGQRGATGLQLELRYDGEALTLQKLSCPDGRGGDTCVNAGVLPSGHSIATLPTRGAWDGEVRMLVYNAADPGQRITEAVRTRAGLSGHSDVLSLVFRLRKAIPADRPVAVEVDGLLGSDAEANALAARLVDGVVVTTRQ